MRPRYQSGLQKHASGSVICPYMAYYGLSKLRNTARTTTVRPDEKSPYNNITRPNRGPESRGRETKPKQMITKWMTNGTISSEIPLGLSMARTLTQCGKRERERQRLGVKERKGKERKGDPILRNCLVQVLLRW
jgi:hypothetical protein